MSENENMDVKDVVQPSQEDTTQSSEAAQKDPQKGSAEYNFREMRAAMAEQERRIQQLQYELSNRAPNTEQVDALESVSEDDFLTRKQAEKLAYKTAQDIIAEREQETLEDRTRLKFKDYDDVVTAENVDELIKDDSDLADSLRNSPNPFAAAYKMIKKASFYEKKTRKNPDAEKIVKNTQKPVSSNAIAERPLTAASSYAQASQAERDALYKEMREFARRA